MRLAGSGMPGRVRRIHGGSPRTPAAPARRSRVAPAMDNPPLGPYKPAIRTSVGDAARGAQVAQLVEHATENRSVGGSIPPLGTTACIDH